MKSKHKRYIRKHIASESPEQIAKKFGLPAEDVRVYAAKCGGVSGVNTKGEDSELPRWRQMPFRIFNMKNKSSNLWWIAGLVLFVSIILLPNIIFLLSPHYIFNGDMRDAIHPLLDLFSEGLKSGHITCWNPYIWSGMPLLGNPNFFFSPPMALIFLISNKINIHFFMDLHFFFEVIFAAIGFFLFSGRWLKGKPFRFGASLLYVCSTAIVPQAGGFYGLSFHFCAIPWALFYLDKLVKKVDIRSGIILALIIHLQLTYGSVQFNLYSIALYCFYTLFGIRQLRMKIKSSAILIASCIFAFLLSAYYLLPLADSLLHFGDKARTGLSINQVIGLNLVPGEYIIRLILPGLFHSQGIPWWPIWRDGWTLFESFTAYQGVIATVTILYGILFLGKELKLWRFLFLFLIFAPTNNSCGIPFLYFLNLGSSMPYGRITLFLVLPGALICFYVLEKLRENTTFFKGYIFFIFISILLLTIFSLRPIIGSFVSNLFTKSLSLNVGSLFQFEPFLKEYYPQMTKIIIRAIILLALSSLLVTSMFIWRRRRILCSGILLLLVILNMVDLMEMNNRFRFGQIMYKGTDFRKLTLTKEHPVEILLKEKDLTQYRIHPNASFGEFRTFAERHLEYQNAQGEDNIFRLGVNANILSRLPMTTGYSGLVPDNESLYKLFYRYNGHFFRAAPTDVVISQGFLNLFSIKYLLLKAESPGYFSRRYLSNYHNDFKVIYLDENLTLFEIADVTPRFYFPESIVFLENEEDMLKNITKDSFDPRKTSYIFTKDRMNSAPIPIPSKNLNVGSISILKNDCDEIELLLNVDSDRVLATTNKWHHWWKCYVNNVPAKIYKINYLFSAVRIPKGTSTISFICYPKSLSMGLFISGLAWVILLLIGGVKLFRGLKSRKGIS